MTCLNRLCYGNSKYIFEEQKRLKCSNTFTLYYYILVIKKVMQSPWTTIMIIKLNLKKKKKLLQTKIDDKFEINSFISVLLF